MFDAIGLLLREGYVKAKTKRRLKTLMERAFDNLHGPSGSLIRFLNWAKLQKGTEKGFCITCGSTSYFFTNHCLACTTRRESAVPEEKKEKVVAPEGRRQLPITYWGTAGDHGPCENHPEAYKAQQVLAISISAGSETKYLCATCAKSLLEDLLRDYVKEAKGKHPTRATRFWWPVFKESESAA